MRRFLLALASLAFIGSMAFISTPIEAQEVPSGSITVVERARCDTGSFNGCSTSFGFNTRGTGLHDFDLDAARRDRDFNEEEFTGLAAGVYTIEQVSADWPLISIYCYSESRRGADVSYSGSRARVNLRAGEAVTCEFSNSPATPTATPSPTATPTLQPTATPLPTATPGPVQTVAPPQVVVVQIPVQPTPEPVVAPVSPVRVVPPSTGSGGLLIGFHAALRVWQRHIPATWGDADGY